MKPHYIGCLKPQQTSFSAGYCRNSDGQLCLDNN